MIDRGPAKDLERAHAASLDLFRLATGLGGSISGEHGVGVVKNANSSTSGRRLRFTLHEGVKRVLDPKNLLNPGKKLARY